MSCMSKSATTARERELYRYYVPADLEDNARKGERPAPKASADPCLTAFAQLGALRLDAKRGVITVSAKDREYIIAESGQRLSLQQDDDEDDKLWHGVGWLAQTGMAQEFATIFSAKDAPSHIYVGDLSKDERFKDTEAVTGLRHIRAIACVPLKTPLHGITIGAYFVVDDRARDEPCLGPRNVEYMQDMAVTIMDYLEANRMKRQQYRAERMVKAIGLFIEGKASLREWWLDHGHKYQHTSSKKRSKGSDALLEEADREFGVQEVTDYFSRSTLSGLNENTSRFSGPPSPSSSGVSGDRGDGRPAMPRGDTLLSDNTTSSPALVSQSWHERNSSVTTFDTIAEQTHDMEKQPSVSFDLPPENVTGDLSRELQNAVLSSEVRGVFARSSNLIREAIGVEGVIYFDASVGSFGGSSDKNAVEEKAPGAFHVDKAATSSEDEIGKKVSDLENGEEVKLWEEQAAESTEKYCNVLGFSTRQRSTLRGHAVSEEHQRMPEAVLRKLLKRYPHGKVFNFDEEGSLSSSESDNKASLTPKDAQSSPNTRTESIARRNRISREAEAKTILSVLPGARSVFWFPLWDQNRERWFSGSLIWSTCPTRTLCPVEDITYLAAFGNSTMAEIARLSAAVLSKMKTDFISSISHELRSPLHGVLASVEFLQETEMTEVQADMVSNIHASGKVLLDTINHVLDFSKVNRKTKNRKRMAKRRLPKKGGRRHSIDESTEEKADVCLLSEEVIESIYAGASIGKKAFDSMGHRQHKVSGTKEPPITIIVDIAWRSNWTFEIDAGAWRRVLMNLFNNAMKYTKHGFVKVSMEIEEDVSSQKKNPRSNLTLRVKDSGKGISQEFLRHQLYKPFTQEDNLATGAGLGLSIVKAIIQDLGGRIDFVSEPGVGTEATVQIPLTSATPVDLEKWNIVNEIKEKVSGFRFRLDGFERYPEISEIPTGILSPDAQAAMLLKSSMQSSLTEWFGMQPAPLTLDAAGSDLVVIMEAGLGNISLEDMLQSHPLRTEKAVAIVLTNSYHSGPKVDSHNHFRIFYLPQPYGPHKLAKILHQAFCQPQARSSTSEETVETPVLLTPPTPIETQSLSPTSETHDFAPIAPLQTISLPHIEPILIPKTAEERKEEISEVREPPTPVTASTPIVTVHQEDGMRVLLVEDNEINLKLLVATMRKLKLDHVTATNGLEALNSYKDCGGKFDVIFMDISMPIMSGIESTRHIRRFEKEKGLEPVALIALTGAANPSTRQEAFSSGVDLFLTKPVPMKALRGMLDDLKREGRKVFAG